jgi:hypothetical protein
VLFGLWELSRPCRCALCGSQVGGANPVPGRPVLRGQSSPTGPVDSAAATACYGCYGTFPPAFTYRLPPTVATHRGRPVLAHIRSVCRVLVVARTPGCAETPWPSLCFRSFCLLEPCPAQRERQTASFLLLISSHFPISIFPLQSSPLQLAAAAAACHCLPLLAASCLLRALCTPLFSASLALTLLPLPFKDLARLLRSLHLTRIAFRGPLCFSTEPPKPAPRSLLPADHHQSIPPSPLWNSFPRKTQFRPRLIL